MSGDAVEGAFEADEVDDEPILGPSTSLDWISRREQQARLLINPEPGWALNYGAMAFFAAFIAGLGMMMNSAPIVIGAMLVAPVMRPVLGLGFSCIGRVPRADVVRIVLVLFVTSVGLVALGAALAVLVPSTSIGLAGEVASRTAPDVRDMLVALAAGSVGAFAIIRPKAADAIAGVAIAVALVPPPVAAGIALGSGARNQAVGAIVLYATNLVAIVLGTVVTTLLLRLVGERPFSFDRQRLALASLLAGAAALAIGSYLFLAFQQRVGDAAAEREEASRSEAAARTSSAVEAEIEAWIAASEEPNLSVVSIDVPPATAETPTVAVVLLGGSDSYVPPLGDLTDRVGEVLNRETYLSVRLVAVADQVSSRVEATPTPEVADPRVVAMQAALAGWTTDRSDVEIRVLGVSAPTVDDRLTVSLALDGPLPPTDDLDELLADDFGSVPPYDLILSELLVADDRRARFAPEPSPLAVVILDGRTAEVSRACRLSEETDDYRVEAASVGIEYVAGSLTVDNGEDSISTDEVSSPLTSGGDTSILVANFDPDATGVGVVELILTVPPSALPVCV